MQNWWSTLVFVHMMTGDCVSRCIGEKRNMTTVSVKLWSLVSDVTMTFDPFLVDAVTDVVWCSSTADEFIQSLVQGRCHFPDVLLIVVT